MPFVKTKRLGWILATRTKLKRDRHTVINIIVIGPSA